MRTAELNDLFMKELTPDEMEQGKVLLAEKEQAAPAPMHRPYTLDELLVRRRAVRRNLAKVSPGSKREAELIELLAEIDHVLEMRRTAPAKRSCLPLKKQRELGMIAAVAGMTKSE